jgi:hypothetical protein
VVVGWKLIPSFLRRTTTTTTRGEKRLSKIKTHHRNISFLFQSRSAGPERWIELGVPGGIHLHEGWRRTNRSG